jgi:hypothetical protein
MIFRRRIAVGTCKCGCGERLSLGAGRTSGRACYVASFKPGLVRLKESLSDIGGRTDDVESLIRRGDAMSSRLLDGCHNPEYYSNSIPSPKEFGDWERDALRMCERLKELDPGFYQQWGGPTSRGPLIRS